MSTQDTLDPKKRRYLNRRPRVAANVPTRSSGDADRYPIPAEVEFAASYRSWISQISGRLPAEASQLQDLLTRVESSNATFTKVKQEEQDRIELDNEDARQANIDLLIQIDEHQSKINVIKDEYRPRVEEQRQILDNAKIAEALQRAYAGELPSGDDPDDEKLYEEVQDADAEKAALETASAGTATPASTTETTQSSAEPATTEQTTSASTSASSTESNSTSAPSNQSTPEPAATDDKLPEGIAVNHEGLWIEAQHLAKREEELALDLGLTKATFAAEIIATKFNKVVEIVALIVCGALFGFSIQQLLPESLPSQLSIAQSQMVVPFVILGMFIFYLMGGFVKPVAAYASGMICVQHLNAAKDEGNIKRNNLHKGVSIWTGIVLLVFFVILVYLEATVEGKGLFKELAEKATSESVNASISGQTVANKTNGSESSMSKLEMVMMMLTFSLPYLLVQFRGGWIASWEATTKNYIMQMRVADVQKHFDRLVERREDALLTRNDYLQKHHEREVQLKSEHIIEQLEAKLRKGSHHLNEYSAAYFNGVRVGGIPRKAHDDLHQPDQTHDVSEDYPEDGETHSSYASESGVRFASARTARVSTEKEPLLSGIRLADGAYTAIDGQEFANGSPMAIAITSTQVRNARARLKSIYAERKGKMNIHYGEIKRLRTEMRTEKPALDDQAHQLLSVQHTRRSEAAKAFSKQFQRIKKRWERITGQSLGCHLYRWFVDNPA
jgi:hypothetical protein